MSELKKELENLVIKSKDQQWFVDFFELDINTNPFASGTTSNIYDCNWRGTSIAVKKLKIETNFTIKDFLNEIKIWHTIRHPNIVQFLGVSIHKDAIYLLLQKIEGMSLKDYILKKNNLSEKLKIKLSKQIVSIFYFLHKCNPPIIYRDLKAENILIESEKVYLTDFGLSRFYPDDNNYKMTGNTGTLRYMAPEVFKKKNYNLKVDIYSIGMIIYFIFKMKLPFDGYDKKTIIEYLDHDRNMKFNLQNVIVKKVIENCINKNIEKRFDIIQLSEQINKIKKSKYLLFFI